MSALELFATSSGVCLSLFFITWFFAVRWDNYSIVDPVWSLAFAVGGVILAWRGSGWAPRRLLLAALFGAWGLRLGVYLALRIASHHPREDGRYVQLRQEYGARVRLRFLAFYGIQAVSVVFLQGPFIQVATNADPIWNVLELVGVIVWMVGLAGESLADAQMSRFRSNPSHAGRVCEVGLWRYSRHPNYFFESVIWWGLFLVASGSGAWFAVYAPLTILFLLLKVTGVPMAEAQSLKSRGESYRRYQSRTSIFIPLPPRHE